MAVGVFFVIRMAIAGSLHSLRVVFVDACCELFPVVVFVVIPVIVLILQRIFEFVGRHHNGALALDFAGVFLVVRTFWALLIVRGDPVVRQVLVAFGAISKLCGIVGGRVIPFIRVLGGIHRLLANNLCVVCSGDESPRLVCQLEARPFCRGMCVCVVTSHLACIGRLFDCYYNYKRGFK